MSKANEGPMPIIGLRNLGRTMVAAILRKVMQDNKNIDLKNLIPFEKMKTFLSSIIQSSSDGIWVCSGSGQILFNNLASEKLTGVKSEEVLGKNVAKLVERGLWKTSVTLGAIATKQKYTTIQDVKRTAKRLLSTATPVFNEKGDIELVVTIERDITLFSETLERLELVKEREALLIKELKHLKQMEDIRKTFVVESQAMADVVKKALKIANLNESNILITGESGTGKGQLAKIMHNNSIRCQNAFIQINCAALPESLLEAELFGYEKGAFTGAKDNGKLGLIELAQNGTLFLDEIGDLPISTQAKLLTYLDNRTITPLGSNQAKEIDCTIIAATNRNLSDLVTRKIFRKDLFFRLNAFSVWIPPLRERPEDIYALTDHFLKRYNQRYKEYKKIGPTAMECLMLYDFPGNIRELKNIIKRAVAICDRQTIDEAIVQSNNRFEAGPFSSQEPAVLHSPNDLNRRLCSYENIIFNQAIKDCNSTRELAAMLKISQPTVVRRLKKLGLNMSSS
jgi:PAS domain S-box-containing protein